MFVIIFKVKDFVNLLNGNSVASLRAKVVQKLNSTLVTMLVLAEGIDDPDLAKVNCSGQGSGLLVAGNELDILDTTSL